MRQCDPLSPMLLCIVEEVLSRSISLLVQAKKIKLIQEPKGFEVSFRYLYVDDVMVFSKGDNGFSLFLTYKLILLVSV